MTKKKQITEEPAGTKAPVVPVMDQDQKQPESTQKAANINVIDTFDAVDREIIRLKIEKSNITNLEIARRLGVSRECISARYNKPEVKQAIAELQKPALEILLDAQAEAARTMLRLMRDRDKDISFKAAKEVLKGVLSENINFKGFMAMFKGEISAEDSERVKNELAGFFKETIIERDIIDKDTN